MKKYFILLVAVVFLSGCANVNENNNGENDNSAANEQKNMENQITEVDFNNFSDLVKEYWRDLENQSWRY